MRPEERIDIFCNLLAKKWKEQGVDLRFTQFLINNGIQISNSGQDLWYMEELEFLNKFFPDIDPAEYLLWGTYGKDGTDALKYIHVSEMSAEHIQAILKNHKNGSQLLSQLYIDTFNNILEKKFNKNTKFELDDGSYHTKEAIKALKSLKNKKKLIKKDLDKKRKK